MYNHIRLNKNMSFNFGKILSLFLVKETMF